MTLSSSLEKRVIHDYAGRKMSLWLVRPSLLSHPRDHMYSYDDPKRVLDKEGG